MQRLSPSSLRLHTAIIGGVISLILTMGLARFTYSIALPRMQHALGFNDDLAGWLAAINFAGYLSGALLSSRLNRQQQRVTLFRVSLFVAVIANALMPLTETPTLWSLLRFLSGISSAGGMVAGTSLLMGILHEHGKPTWIGIHFGGVGVGIACTAWLLGGAPEALAWQTTWYGSACLGLLCLIPALYWLTPSIATTTHALAETIKVRHPAFALLLVGYFFTGATFSTETTFMVKALAALPNLQTSASTAWLLTGLAAAPSCFIWVRLAARYGHARSLLLATGLQTFGCLMTLWVDEPLAVLVGSGLFGFTFMGIVAIVLALAARLSPQNPAYLMGMLVVAYGIGQILGPLGSGWWMTYSGNGMDALLVASVLSISSLLCMGLLTLPRLQLPVDQARAVASIHAKTA